MTSEECFFFGGFDDSFNLFTCYRSIQIFSFFFQVWFGSLYVLRNLYISSSLSNLLAYSRSENSLNNNIYFFKVSSDAPTFISDVSYLCPLFILSWCKLKVCHIGILFKQPTFGFIDSLLFLYCIVCLFPMEFLFSPSFCYLWV